MSGHGAGKSGTIEFASAGTVLAYARELREGGRFTQRYDQRQRSEPNGRSSSQLFSNTGSVSRCSHRLEQAERLSELASTACIVSFETGQFRVLEMHEGPPCLSPRFVDEPNRSIQLGGTGLPPPAHRTRRRVSRDLPKRTQRLPPFAPLPRNPQPRDTPRKGR